MDPLDFLESTELLQFLHCHKTELSCLEKPHTLLSQLRDHNLIPEHRYQKLINMRSKDYIKKNLYSLLDWLEKERSDHIHLFWRCLFKDTVMNTYPSLKMLHRSLMDGSYRCDTQYPPPVEKKEVGDKKRSASPDDTDEDEEEVNSPKKKTQQGNGSTCDKKEQRPGPSSQSGSGQKRRSSRICFTSPQKKGTQRDIWLWPLYQSQLPVTCGSQEGMLSRERLKKGERCIMVDRKWFTPGEFEKLAGKEKYKNWKHSIQCDGTPLAKLFEEGHLKSPGYKGQKRRPLVRKSLFPGSELTVSETEEEDEDEEEEEEQGEEEEEGHEEEERVEEEERLEEDDDVESRIPSSGNNINSSGVSAEDGDSGSQAEHSANGCQAFTVTCEGLTGTLHHHRFASGTLGKCIRTEKSWLTPVEFTKEATCQTNISWKKDIKCEGEPLGALVQAGILKVHSLLCHCRLCSSDKNDQENQRNDDECSVCRNRGKLVMCDHCPRSFHHRCHLPHVITTTEWMCTLCVATQEWLPRPRREMEEAASLLVGSKHMLECQYLLMCLLTAQEMRALAVRPGPEPRLDTDSDDNHILKSLDFVADKLQKKEYDRVGDFLEDIRFCFAISASDDPEDLDRLRQLKDLFNNRFKEVFNVGQEVVDCFEQS